MQHSEADELYEQIKQIVEEDERAPAKLDVAPAANDNLGALPIPEPSPWRWLWLALFFAVLLALVVGLWRVAFGP